MRTPTAIPTLNDIRINPDLMHVLAARAHRDRSQAVGKLIVALIEGIRQRLTQKPGLGKLFARMG